MTSTLSPATATTKGTAQTSTPKIRNRRGRSFAAALVVAGVSGLGGFVAGAQESETPSIIPTSDSIVAAETVAMNRAIARFAAENNLTGLSPVSLTPVPPQTLAEFAEQNNLTGLSPASLAPIASPEQD